MQLGLQVTTSSTNDLTRGLLMPFEECAVLHILLCCHAVFSKWTPGGMVQATAFGQRRACCQRPEALTPEFWAKQGVTEVDLSPEMPEDKVPPAFLRGESLVRTTIAGVDRTSMSPVSTDAVNYRPRPMEKPYDTYEWLVQIALPIFVLALGILFSAMAFYSFAEG